MLVTTLRVDGQNYNLPNTIDIAAVKAQIIAAVCGSAAFVDFDTLGNGQVSVLITPQTPVRFEIVERTQEEVEEWTFPPPTIDVDLEYLSYGL